MFSLKIDKRAKEYKIKSNRKAFLADNSLFKKFDILEKEIFKFERLFLNKSPTPDLKLVCICSPNIDSI